MTRDQIEAAVNFFAQLLKEAAPKDTGNLAFHAIKVDRVSDTEFKIYVHTEGEHKRNALDGIAPYQRYINEKPESRHYHWWEKAIENSIDALADRIGGNVTKDIFENLDEGGNK